jgi:hypothetical protein
MTAGPGDAPGPAELAPADAASDGGAIEPRSGQLPADFAAEVGAAVRYESGLVVKAAAVLAVLAVFLVLRVLYLG